MLFRSLDRMTQQNAALVEESAAAAQSLLEQASRLSQVVGTFRLDDAPPQATEAPAARVAVKAAAARPAGAKQVAVTVAPPWSPSSPSSSTKPPLPAKPATPAASDDWETF